jgi:hypothetical protein
VLARLHAQEALLEDAVLNSELPEEPDRAVIDAFLVDAYRRVWAGEVREPPSVIRSSADE